MNWPQIGSQVLSTLIAGAVAAGPLGLAAKFYLDRSLKRLEASAGERLEMMKDELNQKRDSRQARINQSNYATLRSLRQKNRKKNGDTVQRENCLVFETNW
jgi:hypothetical protein